MKKSIDTTQIFIIFSSMKTRIYFLLSTVFFTLVFATGKLKVYFEYFGRICFVRGIRHSALPLYEKAKLVNELNLLSNNKKI